MRTVAFLDNSIYAQSVVDHTAWLTASSGAGVDLVQIVSPRELLASRMGPIHPGGFVVLDESDSLHELVEDHRRRADEQLAGARARLEALGVSDIRVRLLEGNVPDMMLEAAEGAACIVIGKRGEHADLARLPLGWNFERLLRASPAPVLAVSRGFRPVNRMSIAADFDPETDKTVETVAKGLLPKVPVQLLHAGKRSEPLQTELSQMAGLLTEQGYEVTTKVVDGLPQVVIPRRVVSDDIDLVAMGGFGRSRLKSLIFGSVASDLIRACQVPILLCR